MARGSRSNRNQGRSNSKSRSGQGRSRRPPTNRQFPRTARLNSLLHQIVADFFERVDDDRFDLVTIAGVEVDSDLNKARVYISDPDLMSGYGEGDEAGEPERSGGDEYILEALGEYRRAIQAKIGRETRIRKTPEVVFEVDPGTRTGARIDAILSTLDTDDTDDTGDASDTDDAGDTNETEAAYLAESAPVVEEDDESSSTF